MDLMPPVEASHVSQYKATTLKPTVIYSARQHANEVSSTSHVLKLAELLLTDPEHRKKLDKVNVVIHPITNADGAQLAFDLYEKTPELILHAGYLASLGMDVTSDGNRPMPIYPESTVRRRLWEMWLPDIFLNPHGYPSHQLVQLFSEYTGLVRRGRITERNWSMNKGWFIPGFSYTDDARFPRHKEAAFEIRDYITKAINAAEDVYAMNQRNYDRYRRYGADFDDQEDLQASHGERSDDPHFNQRKPAAPSGRTEPWLQPQSHDLERLDGGSRRNGAWRLDEARRHGRPGMGQSDLAISRRRRSSYRAQRLGVLGWGELEHGPSATAEASREA